MRFHPEEFEPEDFYYHPRVFLSEDTISPPRTAAQNNEIEQNLAFAVENGLVYFSGMNFTGGHYPGINLMNAQLGLCLFNECNLTGARLNRANMAGAILDNANCKDAQMVGVILDDTDLNGTNFQGANLAAANWNNASWDPETPPILDNKTSLLPRPWLNTPDWRPDAGVIINVHNAFDGLTTEAVRQLTEQLDPKQRTLIEEILFQPPLMLNIENWRQRSPNAPTLRKG